MANCVNPDDLYYDEDLELFVDSETGDMYRDDEGKDPIDFSDD